MATPCTLLIVHEDGAIRQESGVDEHIANREFDVARELDSVVYAHISTIDEGRFTRLIWHDRNWRA